MNVRGYLKVFDAIINYDKKLAKPDILITVIKLLASDSKDCINIIIVSLCSKNHLQMFIKLYKIVESSVNVKESLKNSIDDLEKLCEKLIRIQDYTELKNDDSDEMSNLIRSGIIAKSFEDYDTIFTYFQDSLVGEWPDQIVQHKNYYKYLKNLDAIVCDNDTGMIHKLDHLKNHVKTWKYSEYLRLILEKWYSQKPHILIKLKIVQVVSKILESSNEKSTLAEFILKKSLKFYQSKHIKRMFKLYISIFHH